VSRAGSDRQRRRNEGEAYKAEALASARGRAAATVNRAEADRAARAARASGEADAFRYVAAARAAQPALTDVALYWDLIADALAGKAKLVLAPGTARPRHLILAEPPPGPLLPAVVSPTRDEPAPRPEDRQ